MTPRMIEADEKSTGRGEADLAEVVPGVWLDSRRALIHREAGWMAAADVHFGYEVTRRAEGGLFPLWGMAVYPHPGFSPAVTNVWLIGTVAMFLFGWGISRGANLQKYTFKRWPDRKFLGLVEPEYIEAGGRRILCSGLWGVARHFNYMGEGLLALSIALVFGYFTNPWAWTYFVFIVSLFAYRQRDDDEHCAAKYGADKWAEYRARVKYRIVPGIY